MTLPVLILRPMDGALKTQERAGKLGLSCLVDPLFILEPVAWDAPEAGQFDALLLTSANAVGYGGSRLERYRSLPAIAVGQKTATAAEKAGFRIAVSGAGGVIDLLQQLPEGRYRNILWLAGEEHIKVDPAGREITVVPVYRSRPIPLGERATSCLAGETVLLLHSARSAKHLAAELERLQIPRNIHHIVAFSASVADAAGSGWKSVQTADRPDDDALLSLASTLCRSD